MPETESTVESVREQIGEILIERTDNGCALTIKAPRWGAWIDAQPAAADNAQVMDSSGQYSYVTAPTTMDNFFVHSRRSLWYDGRVNHAALLCKGLGNGVRFEFPGVFTTVTLKKIAESYKTFLVKSYEDYSRPVRIQYRIFGE